MIVLFRQKKKNNCELHNVFEIISLSLLLLIMEEYLNINTLYVSIIYMTSVIILNSPFTLLTRQDIVGIIF